MKLTFHQSRLQQTQTIPGIGIEVLTSIGIGIEVCILGGIGIGIGIGIEVHHVKSIEVLRFWCGIGIESDLILNAPRNVLCNM